MDHEAAFVRAFIVSNKRDRYATMLASKKRRRELLDGLNHCADIDYSYASPIPGGEQKAAQIEKILRSHGAPDGCHVISDNPTWDQKQMLLSEATRLVCGSSTGTVLCCVPGRLAYYESEEMHGRYILLRKA